LGGITSAMTSLVYKSERDKAIGTVKDTKHTINEYSKEMIVVKDTINESNTDCESN
jgi:hypothetical protein